MSLELSYEQNRYGTAQALGTFLLNKGAMGPRNGGFSCLCLLPDPVYPSILAFGKSSDCRPVALGVTWTSHILHLDVKECSVENRNEFYI